MKTELVDLNETRKNLTRKAIRSHLGPESQMTVHHTATRSD